MTIHDEINRRCHAFAQEIAELVTSTVREAFGELSFNGVRSPGLVRIESRGPGRPPGKQAPKRTAGELDALAERFHEQVRSNPGHRIEVLAEAMEVSTRDLVLPVKKLIAAKRLTTKGQKRATRYWAR